MQDQVTPNAGLRPIFPAPFGWHARYILSAYLRDTFLVMSVVLTVALSIDLASHLGQVLEALTDKTILGSGFLIGWYISVRSIDKVAEFLPFAIFFGVFWTEIRHTMSHERLIVLITGRAPLQCLAPLIWFALLMFILELILILYLRPAAVMDQANSHLGEYGEEFDRSRVSDRKWMVAGNNLVEAQIDFSAIPRLVEVRLFRMDSDHRLREIINARSATPADQAGSWLFQDGRRRLIESDQLSEIGPAELTKPSQVPEVTNDIAFERELVDLKIDPRRLRYFGIPAKFLPIGIFQDLENLSLPPDNEYLTWAQARFSIPVAAGGMALLAGSLSLMLLANKITVHALLFVGICGFAAHILTTLFILMGDHGWIPPVLAGWIIPTLILTFPFAVYQSTKIWSSKWYPSTDPMTSPSR